VGIGSSTSIAFGGPDLRTLFVTSATQGLPADTLGRWPHAGSVFQVERPTPGRPANVFGGTPWATCGSPAASSW